MSANEERCSSSTRRLDDLLRLSERVFPPVGRVFLFPEQLFVAVDDRVVFVFELCSDRSDFFFVELGFQVRILRAEHAHPDVQGHCPVGSRPVDESTRRPAPGPARGGREQPAGRAGLTTRRPDDSTT